MENAWSVFGLSPSATDEEIRRRYLELVREFSPEHEPERFAEISKAYKELRDPIDRVRRRLFYEESGEDLDVLIDRFRGQMTNIRIPTSSLLSLANET